MGRACGSLGVRASVLPPPRACPSLPPPVLLPRHPRIAQVTPDQYMLTEPFMDAIQATFAGMWAARSTA